MALASIEAPLRRGMQYFLFVRVEKGRPNQVEEDDGVARHVGRGLMSSIGEAKQVWSR